MLVVEDTESVRVMVAETLLLEGNQVTEAKDGLEGLAALAVESFDLIITDLRMPRVDGYKMIEKARQLGNSEKVPILVMSADTDDPSVDRAFAAGATSRIDKPFSPGELLAVVERLMKPLPRL